MVKNDSPIKTMEDLVGKKIAVVTVGGACDLILNDVLREKGLDYKSIGYTVMGVPDMAPNRIARRRRCSLHSRAPAVCRAGQGGIAFGASISSRATMIAFRLSVSRVPRQFAETNPNTVAALQRALAKGLSFAHNNQDKLREIISNLHDFASRRSRNKIVLSYTPEKSDFTQLKKIGRHDGSSGNAAG